MRKGLGRRGGSRVAGVRSRVNAQRVNITLPEEVHRLLKAVAQEHYGGNFSRFLGDAGMFYAGVLRGGQESLEGASRASKED